MSGFTAPVKVRGPIEVGDLSPNVDIGDVLVSQTNTFDFNDISATDMFTIPANAQLIEVYVDTTTIFNAGTTNTLDIGKTGSGDFFADGIAIGPIGRIRGTSDASQVINYPDLGTERVVMTATYVPTGTAATTGAATITAVYAIRTSLPA